MRPTSVLKKTSVLPVSVAVVGMSEHYSYQGIVPDVET